MLARHSHIRSVPTAIIASVTFSLMLLIFASPSSALSGRFDTKFASGGSAVLEGHVSDLRSRDQIAVAPNGSFAVIGTVARPARKSFDGTETYDGSRWSVSLYSRNGKLESRFGKNGTVVLRFPGESATYPRKSVPTAIRFDRQGRLLIAGAVDHAIFEDFREASRGAMQLGFADVQNDHLGLVRLTRSGKPDRSFGKRGLVQVRLYERTGPYGPAEVRAIGLGQLPNGLIIVGATNTKQGGYLATGVFAFTANGELIEGFGTRGKKIVHAATSLRVGSGGRIYLGGIRYAEPNPADLWRIWTVTKLKPDGHIDTRYGKNGVASLRTKLEGDSLNAAPLVDTTSFDIAPDGVGRVLVTGALPQGPAGFAVIGVARFGIRGSLDKSFGRSGVARAPLGTNTSSSGSSIAINRFGEIFAGGTINTLPFNTRWEVGGLPFAQGVVAKFDDRGNPARKWAKNGVQHLTPAGIKSCPYGPQLAIQAKLVLAAGCWRDGTWGKPGEVFRLKP